MKNKPFENFDFTDFWDDDEYAMNEYIGAPPTEEMIEETERELGYKLPESYIWLMKQHNGGIPFNVCFQLSHRSCPICAQSVIIPWIRSDGFGRYRKR